jgi:hypothetical protein
MLSDGHEVDVSPAVPVEPPLALLPDLAVLVPPLLEPPFALPP